MITEKDLQEAIAECQGQRNPNSSTCIKLAAFLTIKEHLFGNKEETPTYSYSYGPVEQDQSLIDYYSDSEFARAIDGRKQEDIWPIVDELMSTIQVLNPRLYASVIRRIQE